MSLSDVIGSLVAAKMALQSTIAQLAIKRDDDGTSDEDKALIGERLDGLTEDSEDLQARINALSAEGAAFQPPSDAVLQSLKDATRRLSEVVQRNETASALFDATVGVFNAARSVTGGG